MQQRYGEQNRYRHNAELEMKTNMAGKFKENILKL